MKKLIILIALGFIALFTQMEKVSACSGWGAGGEGQLPDLLDEADIVISGHFVELDSLEMNGVFQVESYLMGDTNDKYLLLAMNDVLSIRNSRKGRFSGGCNSLFADFSLGVPSIIVLKRQLNGSYKRSYGGITYFNFPEPNATVDAYINYWKGQVSFTKLKLEMYISEYTRQTKHSPIETNIHYPWKAPILITTVTGTNYLLPVDGSAPVSINEENFNFEYDQHYCYEPPCTVTTPDLLNTIFLFPEDSGEASTIPFPYIRVEGQQILTSPTSEWFALWKENRIEIYGLFYPSIGIYSHDGARQLVQSTEIRATGRNHPAAWSADGRTLAYSDLTGLWLWDISIPNAQPKLLLPYNGNGIPFGRYFSPQGHYLAVEQNDEKFTISIDTGERFPDGLVSPDDRILMTRTDVHLIDLHLLLPTWETKSYEAFFGYDESWIGQWQWYDEKLFFVSGCGQGYDAGEGEVIINVDEPICMTKLVEIGFYLSNKESWTTYGSDYSGLFDYDSQNDQMLRLIGEHRIEVNHQEYDYTGLIEGKIISAEWLPSLFYHDE